MAMTRTLRRRQGSEQQTDTQLRKAVDRLMAQFSDLDTKLDAILAAVKAAPPSGVLTQAQLDGLDAKAQSILDAQKAVVGVPSTTPAITSIAPVSGGAGDTVVVSGKNFGANQNASLVTFGKSTASVRSWTDTSISVGVPSGTGTVEVIATVNGVNSNSSTYLYL